MVEENGADKTILPFKKSHHFVIYGDSCSGIPGSLHESNLASINDILKNNKKKPQFILFPGDEIVGLTNNEKSLKKQWDYWLNKEMNWVKEQKIPFYNSTGNHTTYNRMSERVFREVFTDHPDNGPDDQKGLSYYIIKDDLLMVFVNTMWSGLGGEGRIETHWLESVLSKYVHYKYKLVVGHHPIFPVNGFSGDFQREVEPENGRIFWNILKKHNVFAYICSHILAFDVQIHDGVIQLLTAGAGTDHRMPEGIEYLHYVQAVLDESGLRYQVYDKKGQCREWLKWPLVLPSSETWKNFIQNDNALEFTQWKNPELHTILVWNISGKNYHDKYCYPQTLISGTNDKDNIPTLWIGLTGLNKRLTVYLSPKPRRSPHHWYGPTLSNTNIFNVQIMAHNGMGPGGLLYRFNDNDCWSSLSSSSPWGLEQINWPIHWSIGKNMDINEDLMEFKGKNLEVKSFSLELNYSDL
jgi:hypothetical protein